MTDYNDGKWHGWNGGKCPVHPESEVEVAILMGKRSLAIHGNEGIIARSRIAKTLRWDSVGDSSIVAFRVTKAHRETREYWLMSRGFSDVISTEKKPASEGWIHVREVLE